MGPMATMLLEEARKCDHVESVYCSPHAPAFVVLSKVGTRTRTSGRDTIIEPLYADAIAMGELTALVKKVRDAFPDVYVGWVLAQRTFASDWKQIYRREAQSKTAKATAAKKGGKAA